VPDCIIPRKGAIARGNSKTYKGARCALCVKCLRQLAFKCGDTLAIRARARGNAKAAASSCSDDYVFTPACEGDAATRCYKP